MATNEESTAETAETGRTKRAAGEAADRNDVRLTLPVVGTVSVPARRDLAYIGGIAALAALSVIEWPIALTLAAGHLLASTRGSKVLRDFGAALDEA